MKRTRKFATTLILLLSLFMTFSCVAQAKTYTRKIKPYEGAIFIIKQKGLANKKAKWTVDNGQIATVNKKGVVTGRAAGKATIQLKMKVGKKVYRGKSKIYWCGSIV